MRRLSLLIAAVALLAAACGPATSPSESPTSSPTASTAATGCAAQLAAGKRHYKVVRAEITETDAMGNARVGTTIDLADKGVGLSLGYDAFLDPAYAEGTGVKPAFYGLALYAPVGVILMSGVWYEFPDRNEERLQWIMGGLAPLNLPVPAALSSCPLFTLPISGEGSSAAIDQEKAAALDDVGLILTSFALFGGSPRVVFDPLDKALKLQWGSYWDGSSFDPAVGPVGDAVGQLSLVIEEQPSADYRD